MYWLQIWRMSNNEWACFMIYNKYHKYYLLIKWLSELEEYSLHHLLNISHNIILVIKFNNILANYLRATIASGSIYRAIGIVAGIQIGVTMASTYLVDR